MQTYTFSGGLTQGREQFEVYTDQIVKESILHDDKWANEVANRLCDDWLAYAMAHGPDAEEGRHSTWNFYPPQKSMNKLARLLAGD